MGSIPGCAITISFFFNKAIELSPRNFVSFEWLWLPVMESTDIMKFQSSDLGPIPGCAWPRFCGSFIICKSTFLGRSNKEEILVFFTQLSETVQAGGIFSWYRFFVCNYMLPISSLCLLVFMQRCCIASSHIL